MLPRARRRPATDAFLFHSASISTTRSIPGLSCAIQITSAPRRGTSSRLVSTQEFRGSDAHCDDAASRVLGVVSTRL